MTSTLADPFSGLATHNAQGVRIPAEIFTRGTTADGIHWASYYKSVFRNRFSNWGGQRKVRCWVALGPAGMVYGDTRREVLSKARS